MFPNIKKIWEKNDSASMFVRMIIYAIIFSVSTYAISLYVIHSYVLPQFETVLKVSLNDAYKNIDKRLLVAKNMQTYDYNQLVDWLSDNKKNYQVENVYILGKKGEREYVVAANKSANAPRNSSYSFSRSMKETLEDNQLRISPIYKDDYGTHKSGFIKLNEEMILGVDIDAIFISRLHMLMMGIFSILIVVMIYSAYLFAPKDNAEISSKK